jgi:hypothetical protein
MPKQEWFKCFENIVLITTNFVEVKIILDET